MRHSILKTHPRLICTALVTLTTFLLSAEHSSHSDNVLGSWSIATTASAQSNVDQKLGRLESTFNEIASTYLEPELRNAQFSAEARLNDGMAAHSLKQYDTAAQLFVQVVSEKDASFGGYRDALYYLADSLVQMRNYIGARGYYRQLILLGPGEHYQDSLAKMLELSYKLNEYKAVEDLYDKLDVEATNSPTLAYLRGKSLFRQKKLSDARRYFDLSAKDKTFAMRAKYYKGVSYVVGGELPKAEAEFKGIVDAPKTKENGRIRALSYLSLGRLAYEQDRYNEAIALFNEVFNELPSGDAKYNEATYETAWANIQLKNYDRAQQLIDILIASAPDAELYTKARLLRADLASRSKDYDKAVDSFNIVLQRYEPVRDQLDTFVKKHDDLPAFFRSIVRDDLTLDIPADLPTIRTDFDTQLPSEWLGASAESNTAQRVVQDVRMTKSDIAENRASLRVVSAKLNSSSRTKIFEKLASGLTTVASIESDMIGIQRGLYDGAVSKSSSLSGSDASAFASLKARVDKLAPKYDAIPQNGDQLQKREGLMKQDYNRLEKMAREAGEGIDKLRAELAALEVYAKTEQVPLSAEQTKQVSELRGELQRTIKMLEQERSALRTELKVSREKHGFGNVITQEEQQLRGKYFAALSAATDFLAARGIQSSSQVPAWSGRLKGLSRKISGYYAKNEAVIDEKVRELKGQVALEEMKINEQEAMIDKMSGTSREAAAQIALNTFLKKRKGFNQIVLRADVGKIDILYQKKEDSTKKINQLFQQRTDELRALQDAFEELK